MITGKAKIAGVMGWPVSHSLSPVLHGHWLMRYGVDGAYIPLPVAPDDVEHALRALPMLGLAGCNVTVPHKEVAMRVMDEVSDVAKRIGAVNTVVVRADGSLFGTNTDAYGFMANVRAQARDVSPYAAKALVIGAGGAARAIVAALQDEGFGQILITNRTREKAETIAQDFGAIEVVDWDEKESALEGCSFVVNTTSLGMAGKSPLALSLDALPTHALVTDIVYTPLMTDLLQHAKDRGNPVVTGLGMLLHQAAAGFEAWFGVTPQVDDRLEDEVMKCLATDQ